MSIVGRIEQNVVEVRGGWVMLDYVVADLYGVATKHVNQAVSNHPEKFPEGYVLTLTEAEWNDLRPKLLTASGRNKTRVLPKAFTEKGLYMLATILKSRRATETTLSIIETFAKIRELGRSLQLLATLKNEEEKEPILRRGGKIIADMLENDLDFSESETSIELNVAFLKFRHTVKKERPGKKKTF